MENGADINDLPNCPAWRTAAVQLYGSPRADSVLGTLLTTLDILHFAVRLAVWRIEFRLRPSKLADKWKRTIRLIPQPGMAGGTLSFQNFDEPDILSL